MILMIILMFAAMPQAFFASEENEETAELAALWFLLIIHRGQ